MNRRTFCETLTTGAVAALPLRAAPERPNIVYILADDLGWGDMDVYNPHSAVPTPHCNRSHRKACASLTCIPPAPVCTPSRYSILTGRYPWRSASQKGRAQRRLPEPDRARPTTVPVHVEGARLLHGGRRQVAPGPAATPRGPTSPSRSPRPHSPRLRLLLRHSRVARHGAVSLLRKRPRRRAADLPDPGSKEPRGVFWRAGCVRPILSSRKSCPRSPIKPSPFFTTAPSTKSSPSFSTSPCPRRTRRGCRSPSTAANPAPATTATMSCEVDAMIGRVLDTLHELAIDDNTIVVVTSDNGADWKPGDIERYPPSRQRRLERREGRHLGSRPSHSLHRPLARPHPRQLGQPGVGHSGGFDGYGGGRYGRRPAGERRRRQLQPSPRVFRAESAAHSRPHRHALQRRYVFPPPGQVEAGGRARLRRVQRAANRRTREGGPKGQLYDLQSDPGELHNLYQARPEVVDRLATLLERYRQQGHTRPM